VILYASVIQCFVIMDTAEYCTVLYTVHCTEIKRDVHRRYDLIFQIQGGKIGFYRKRLMQTGSSGTLIGWKSGQTTFVLYMGPTGGSVAMDSGDLKCREVKTGLRRNR
jgi:hypothetical protein